MVKRINVIPYLMSVIAGALNFACSPELLNKEINFLCAVGVQTCQYKLFVVSGSGANYGMAVYPLEDGSFKPKERAQFIGGATQPAQVIHYPKLKTVYVLHQFAGGIRQYQYDDAGVTSLAYTNLTGLVNPQYVTIDSTDNYMLVTELGGGTPGLYSYSINPSTGVLTSQGSSGTSYYRFVNRSTAGPYVAAVHSSFDAIGILEVNPQTGLVSEKYAGTIDGANNYGGSVFSATGDKLYVVNCTASPTVEVWNTADPASIVRVQTFSVPGSDYRIAWNSSQTRLYVIGSSFQNKIHILDVSAESGLVTQLQTQSITTLSNSRIVFNHDDTVAYISQNQRLRAFKVESNGLLGELIFDEQTTGIFYMGGVVVPFGT